MTPNYALRHERDAAHRELAYATQSWMNPVVVATNWELSPELANWGSGKIESFRSYNFDQDDPWSNPNTIKVDRWREAILGGWVPGFHNFEQDANWTGDEVANPSRHPHYQHLAEEDAKRLTLARKQHKAPPAKQQRQGRAGVTTARPVNPFNVEWVENFIRTREEAIRQHQKDFPGRAHLADRPDLMRDRAKLRSFVRVRSLQPINSLLVLIGIQLSPSAREKTVVASVNSLALVMRRPKAVPKRDPLGPSSRNTPAQQQHEPIFSSQPRPSTKKWTARKQQQPTQ